jgi:hypothetical protein
MQRSSSVLAVVLAAFGLFAAAVARADDAPQGAAPGVGGPRPAESAKDGPAASSSVPEGWADVPVVALHAAAAAGSVEATAANPAAYTQVTLRIRNRSPERRAIDVAGSHVLPRKRKAQRLGIGPAVTPSAAVQSGGGKLIVRLEPGAETELRVWTCCLDGGLPAPGDDEVFGASDRKLPEVRENVLRWWIDNPTAPQSAVNQAIWTNSPTVRIGPGVVRNFEKPEGRFAAVHRGVYYRLADGVLTSVDPDGTRRVHGSEVFQVLPTDDGLFAVALGEDMKPKLWQIPTTAEDGWRRVLDLDGTMRIRDVIAAGRGDLVLVTDRGILWYDAAKKELRSALESEVFTHLSVRRAATDRLLVTILRPKREGVRPGDDRMASSRKSEIWELALDTGRAERVDQFWNVNSILAGPSGVFALSHTQGRIRRWSGGKFADFGPEVEAARLLAVARDLVWLVGTDGMLFAVDAKSGAVRHRTGVPAGDDLAFSVDPENGDVAWVGDGRFHRIRGSDGEHVTIE